MISTQREDEMYEYWSDETNDEWTQEWRDELTLEEQKLVDEWDSGYNTGIRKICERILELNKEKLQ
jgi:hypothetical protein